MISQISQNKKLSNLVNLDLTRKVDTDPLPFLLMLVSFPLTSISTEARFTIGVLVVTLRIHPGAMDNASGS